MAENKQDALARAYARFSSLRENITKMGAVEETYVREFHDVLNKLEGIGINVSEFRIPGSKVQPRVTMASYVTGEKSYSEEKYVDESYFLAKLDAILRYFEIITSEKPRRIGFSKPKRS